MITEIKLKLGDKEIVLTQEEALELRNDLNQLLGPQFPIYPYYPPAYPQWQEPHIITQPNGTGDAEIRWKDVDLTVPGFTIGPGYDHPAWVTDRIGYNDE